MKNAIAALLALGVAGIAAAAIPYERAVTAPAYGPAPSGRGLPGVATNGRDFLLVWKDLGRGALYASRVGIGGALLDDTGIRIEPSKPLAVFRPFWSGDAYVLFWTEASGLKSARLDGDGKIIEPPHPVFEQASVWSIATNGARFVVAYGNRLAVLDLTGRLVERDFVLTLDTGIRSVTLTSNGHGFLAAWLTNFGSDLYAVALDASGHPAGTPARISVATHAFVQESNGNEYLMVVNNPLPQVVRLSATGERLSVTALTGVPTGANALSWDGSEYIYTFIDGPIRALRLTAGGAPFAEAAYVTAESGAHTTASIGRKLLLTWSNGATIKAEVLDAATMTHTEPVVVSWSAAEQLAPHIAFDGRNYFLVWQELDAVVAARMDEDGRTLDVNGFKVTDDPRAQSSPNVVFDGAAFLVAWLAGKELWMRRIDAGDGVRVATNVCAYDVATDGSVALVAFSDCTTRRLQALRVNRTLLPIDVPLAITPPTMKGSNPSIAWSGTQWLVAFEEQIDLGISFEGPPVFRGNIRAARITPSMTLLDTQPIGVASSEADLVTLQSPHAASSGDDYLITWTRGFPIVDDVRARHLLPNGTLGATTLAAAGTGTSTIWTGTEYAIGFTSRAGDALGLALDAGTLFKISATTDPEGSVALIAVSGRITGAYTRQATEPVYGGVARVFVRDARPLRGRAAAH